MRLATMVQMLGVIVLALGLEQAFASIDDGDVLDNGVMVAGYVVMRVPMMFLWARAARHDPRGGAAAITYIWTISVAQVFWVVLAIVDLPIGDDFAIAAVLIALEIAGPFVAQRRKGGTPWHAHHIAERYGLLVIITLGEGIIGTVASINAVVHGDAGWTVEAGIVAFAGVGLIFATWWTYFVIPWADVLSAAPRAGVRLGLRPHRDLRVARRDRRAACTSPPTTSSTRRRSAPAGTVLSTAIPFAIYIVALYALYASFTRHADPFHLSLLAGTTAVLVLSVALATLGVGVAACLLVLMFAPVVTVVGYETVGHRHVADALERMR